jgi:Ca-activated chloride channel family protein
VGRTRVKQTFHNPLNEKIEAVYAFPLPSDAAVDEMVMTVGDRRVVGQVKPREEARAAYERAKSAGNVASLLDQERPNVFTQSVANVEPGAQVVIEISYVETLKYEDGWYEFSFPTVVGPRYMPGTPTGKQGDGRDPDTTKVPDASRISPPITAQGTRAGHDISLTVNIDAGMEVKQVECKSHPVVENRQGDGRVSVALKNQETLPNKDFILRYRTGTDQIADALLTHKDERGSFFTLVLQPPQKVQRKDAVGRELIFVLDTSGSMQGFPVTQAKFVMSKAIDGLGPQDTFNLITFSGDTSILWDAPRPNTPQNREEAQSFLASRQGRGGTEMMKAIDAALVKTKNVKPQAGGAEPIRVVCFMTDGYVGNDMEIIDAVKKNAGTTRVFSFGIGNSVNRFLLDGMAQAGRGEVEYVTLEAKAQEAAERFYRRIDAPVLTDVSIDWGGMGVADVYPKQIPDLFSDKPIIVHGRLTGPGDANKPPTLRGNTAAGKFERKVHVAPAPADGAARDALASLWARAKVGDLMFRDLGALQSGNFPEDLKKQITAVGTEFRLMTQFTSFVAVEELTITKGGQPTKIAVPVEMPDGVSYEGIFGERRTGAQTVLARGLSASGARYAYGGGYGGMMAGRGGAANGPYGNTTQLYAVAPAALPAQAAPAQQQAGQQQAAASGPVPAPRAEKRQRESERLQAVSELSDSEAVADRAAVAAPPDASAKLAEPLRGLAEKVQKQGKDGNLTAGGVAVTGYKVDVMVYLSDASPKTLEALKKLGFDQSAESKAVRLVIGSIDVRKLLELAKLDAVVSVRPVGA